MRAAAVTLALVVAAAAPAAAQPADVFKAKRAAELYELGKRHFDIADYSGAIASWKESYVLSSASLLLFNIAQAYRLAGNCAEANRFYLSYKRVEPRPSNQVELDKAMEKCAGVEPATGESVHEPPPAPLPPAAAPQRPVAPPHTDAPANPGADWKLAGYVTGGAGAVAAVAAVVFAVSARSKANDIGDRPTGTTWNASLAETEDAGRKAETRARVLAGLGVAGLAAGGVLWWVGNGRSHARIDVAASPRHAQIGLTCAF